MKEIIKDAVAKRFNTVTIYPLSQFELAFGHMWGHGKDPENLTEEEKLNREKWEQCRENILNNGNNNRRDVIKQLDKFNIKFQGYTTKFYMTDRSNKDA